MTGKVDGQSFSINKISRKALKNSKIKSRTNEIPSIKSGYNYWLAFMFLTQHLIQQKDNKKNHIFIQNNRPFRFP